MGLFSYYYDNDPNNYDVAYGADALFEDIPEQVYTAANNWQGGPAYGDGMHFHSTMSVRQSVVLLNPIHLNVKNNCNAWSER